MILIYAFFFYLNWTRLIYNREPVRMIQLVYKCTRLSKSNDQHQALHWNIKTLKNGYIYMYTDFDIS